MNVSFTIRTEVNTVKISVKNTTDIIDFSTQQQTYFNTNSLIRACEPHFEPLWFATFNFRDVASYYTLMKDYEHYLFTSIRHAGAIAI